MEARLKREANTTRKLQITLLILGLIAFLITAITAGTNDGDTFWRVGVAFLLTDVVLHQLWPTRPTPKPGPHTNGHE